MSSLLYAVKFLHKEHGPGFKDVQMIRQLRAQATIFQKQGDRERPSSREEFEALNRWLPWDEVVAAVSLQRERFQLSWEVNMKARESCNLVLLSLYVFIPPSRGLEMRTLRIVTEPDSLEARQRKEQNLLVMREDSIVLHFNDYKTKSSCGRDELTLQPGHELYKVLANYIKEFRPRLTKEESGNFLLLNRKGESFSGPAFSAHMKSLFRSLTGKSVTINMLRSAFITWSYGREDCTDALKASLAAALRHSRQQAQRTYDRRTANDRKRLAVDLARDYAEDRLDEGSDGGQAQPQSSDDCPFKAGDFVAVVEEDSRLNCPKVLIGQIHSLGQEGEVSLLWYKNVSKNFYRLQHGSGQWRESVDSLVPVTVKVPKNRPGLYQLCTSPRQIHKVVFAD